MASKLKEKGALHASLSNQLSELHVFITGAASNITLRPLARRRFARAQQVFEKLENLHAELTPLLAAKGGDIDIHEQLRMKFTGWFEDTEELIAQWYPDDIESAAVSNNAANLNLSSITTATVTSQCTQSLPKLELSRFNGDLKTWPSFKAQFESAVHFNTDLSDLQRFRYLLSLLKGEPLNLVSSLTLTEANYQIAYTTLINRYENKRQLSTYYWNCIKEIPTLKSENAAGLRGIIDQFSEFKSALEAMNITDDFLWFCLLAEKLDSTTLRAFECNRRDNATSVPTFADFKFFLETQSQVLSTTEFTKTLKSQGGRASELPRISKSATTLVTTASKQGCVLCKRDHQLRYCDTFKKKSARDRYHICKDLQLCINCFSSSHITIDCTSKYNCRYCEKRHNSLLHFVKDKDSGNRSFTDNISQSKQASPENHSPTYTSSHSEFQRSTSHNGKLAGSSQNPPPVTSLANTIPDGRRGSVFLTTAMVEIQDAYGRFHKARALLDCCSEASFITRRLANRLNLRFSPSQINVVGINQDPKHGLVSAARVDCSLRSMMDPGVNVDLQCHVLPQIAGITPAQDHMDDFSQFRDFYLADPEFYRSRHVDILLGGDVYGSLLTPLVLPGGKGKPSAFGTIFGLIVSGPTSSIHTSETRVTTCLTSLSSAETTLLDMTLRRFWESEELPKVPVKLSPEQEYCENLFEKTTRRNDSGRYTVELPFKSSDVEFGDSYNIALKRFYSLERRLDRDASLKKAYREFMDDYIESGHMTTSQLPGGAGSYYIPHHCVLKEENQSKKIRVVFDASCKNSSGKSLNDVLHPGPTLLKDLSTILFGFRLHPTVFTADIKQMFRQIMVKPDQRKFQQVIWRPHACDEVKTYSLNTVTYGVVSSPFLAMRTLQHLADAEQNRFPLAAEVLRSSVYMDDIVTGAKNEDDALILQDQLIGLLASGQFQLRKWASNSNKLMNRVDPSFRQDSITFESDQPATSVKILGLQWMPEEDVLSFAVQPELRVCSKRALLSQLARIFDPLGFLAPLTFFAKHLIQRLWCLGLDWDELPPNDIVDIWNNYSSQLGQISNIKIPRLCFVDDHVIYEIHGYSDASESGFAAVVYLRVVADKYITTHLLTAKSKVAPLKRRSLPQLELCGAHLLAKLITFVLENLDGQITVSNIVAWCDSTIALAWIKGEPYRWKTFVANRVSEIQERLPPCNWRHVPSKDNPADPASRGLLPAELVENSLWFYGPSWLRQPPEHWPKVRETPSSSDQLDITKEMRIIAMPTTVVHNPIEELISRSSSLSRLKNSFAYVLRFVAKLRTQHCETGPVTLSEQVAALQFLIKQVQSSSFPKELKTLLHGGTLQKPMQRLSPFICPKGLLRVGGRIARATLSDDAKHPILLPRDHHLTKMIIEYTHAVYLHPGRRTLHYLLLQNYWILSANWAIRFVVRNCNRCFRVQPKTLSPPMADLPQTRVQQSKPFSCVGVDFGGPFPITMNRSRGAKSTKAYLCLFVCFATKALHLELVSSLSTEAFLAALRRFIARRGRCTRVYSDRGTNFVGASRKLKTMFAAAAEAESITWSFNPPAAPHFGGLWEAGIKSVKTHLRRVIGQQILSYEELTTVLTQIEALLNSRPLTPASNDPNDTTALSPGHFLTLAPLSCLPDEDLTSTPSNRLCRWKLLQRLHQSFWQRWHKEYLHTVQQRPKWHGPAPQLSIGSLVLVKDENLPPMKWMLARIIDTHPGTDGVIRTVTLKTALGSLVRPAVKICPLPRQ